MKLPLSFARYAMLPAFIGLAVYAAHAEPDPKQRAAAALEQAVKTDPNNYELWSHLGFAYRKEGDLAQAQSAFEKAVSLNPRNTESLYMLGLIYESKHQSQDALRVWKEYLATETDPGKRNIAENHIHHLSQ